MAAGILVGLLTRTVGVFETAAALLALGAVALALRSLWFAFAGVVATIALLPFATLPVGAAVTPTVLELALAGALGLTGAVVALDRRQEIPTGWAPALVLGFTGMTAFAFLLGLGRGYTTQTLHDYLKLVLAIAVFFVAAQLVRGTADARLVLWLLTALTSAAGTVATVLYAGGPGVTERLLLRLVPFGYPGGRIVRFIEDDPAKPMRAVGTSVDPNAFGGLLMVGFVLAAGQLLARRRSTAPLLAGCACVATGVPLLLTYSRGAWVGAFAGVMLVVLLRRRTLLVPLAGLGAAGLWLGVGAGFVERLWLGFTLQDPATKLRLSEHRNAWEIIQRHPWFGVGYGEAPSLELQTGVSSAYLTVAEQAGLVGLAVFLVAVGVVLVPGLRGAVANRGAERDDLALCFTAALVAALTVGLVDHYLVNPQFPHMVALFWLLAAMVAGLAAGRTTQQGDPVVSCQVQAAQMGTRAGGVR